MINDLQLEFLNTNKLSVTSEQVTNPDGYKGLYGFHKYWGKKPMETYGFLIEKLTQEGEVVCDPFLGSGVAALEAFSRNRRFIGCDINPIAVGLSRLLISPPDKSQFQKAFNDIEFRLKEKINDSYVIKQAILPASHYLWKKEELLSVWQKANGVRRRIELEPTSDDLKLAESFNNYKCHRLRSGKFFSNSRINSSANLTIRDLFTGRALRNIEMILDAIDKYEPYIQDALKYCLTAASGQMSSMVFAISNRGKKQGEKSERIEVGSWVIGYWRPELHFEINVWNCFESRAMKFFKALPNTGKNGTPQKFNEIDSVLFGENRLAIDKKDAIAFLSSLPESSIHSVITDPPHSDRIPYLELSELWNVLISEEVDFEKEIVVSNAKERGKNKDQYFLRMTHFVSEVGRVLSQGGIFALMFNARDDESWKFYDIIEKSSGLEYQGYFEVTYSANSVVQDNREGSLQDYVLIFRKPSAGVGGFDRLEIHKKLPGWKSECPRG